ncbi:MAG: hypothetical protein ACI9DS_001864 [Glaciecola sp.]
MVKRRPTPPRRINVICLDINEKEHAMSVKKKVTLILILIGLSLFAPLTWYKVNYSMDFIPSYSVQSDNPKRKLLIATQGSEYKNALVAGIIDAVKNRPVDVQVIDVSALPDVNIDEWSAIIILHTWENWQPQKDAMLFIDRNPDLANIIVLTTSGQGDLKMEAIDAITSASDISNIEKDTAQIVRRIDSVITND